MLSLLARGVTMDWDDGGLTLTRSMAAMVTGSSLLLVRRIAIHQPRRLVPRPVAVLAAFWLSLSTAVSVSLVTAGYVGPATGWLAVLNGQAFIWSIASLGWMLSIALKQSLKTVEIVEVVSEAIDKMKAQDES